MLKLLKNKPLMALLFLIIITSWVSISVISASKKVKVNQKTPAQTLKPSPSKNVLSESTSSAVPSPKSAAESADAKKAASSDSAYPAPKKQTYVIAAFGDSMVETMGDNLDYLQKSLQKRYPQTEFKLYNYGIGSQNVVEGLARFHDPYVYKNRNFLPIDKINTDIIIISSFAYNPLVPYDRDKHWTTLMQLIKEAQKTNSKVYLLAEIAPLRTGFGRGPGGIDWTDEMIKAHVPHIIEQLDNAIKLSENLGVPLINAYTNSQTDGKYGNPIYVETHDHIHPSIEGEIFMAELIASTVQLP